MARKRYNDEDILRLLREIEVHLHGDMTDVEGQFDPSGGKYLKAIVLVGLEGLWGKVLVIVFIHLGIHSSQYKSTPGQLLGWG